MHGTNVKITLIFFSIFFLSLSQLKAPLSHRMMQLSANNRVTVYSLMKSPSFEITIKTSSNKIRCLYRKFFQSTWK